MIAWGYRQGEPGIHYRVKLGVMEYYGRNKLLLQRMQTRFGHHLSSFPKMAI